MEDKDFLLQHEARIQSLEQFRAEFSARMGKVEDKSDGAWHTIREINGRMDKLEERMKRLEADVKQVKSTQESINRSLKILIGVVTGLGIIVAGFLVYIWKHDAQLAQSILGLGSMIGKIVAV